ncbi:MAG: hypothetical protein FWD68_00710 [Alphaproteobacteria bacterium]|nr:hypothetical protein [Alphaproteobacteria bacterium]
MIDSMVLASLNRFWHQLLPHAPALLAYAAGIVAAFQFRERYPGPARLTLISMILLLIATPASLLLPGYLVLVATKAGWPLEQSERIMSAMINVVFAIAYALIVASVVKGRSEMSGERQAVRE